MRDETSSRIGRVFAFAISLVVGRACTAVFLLVRRHIGESEAEVFVVSALLLSIFALVLLLAAYYKTLK